MSKIVGPSFMSEIFNLVIDKYNLRTKQGINIPKVYSVKHRYQSVSFRAAIIWIKLPSIYKEAYSLPSFKVTIKQWKGDGCHCHICLKFLFRTCFYSVYYLFIHVYVLISSISIYPKISNFRRIQFLLYNLQNKLLYLWAYLRVGLYACGNLRS